MSSTKDSTDQKVDQKEKAKYAVDSTQAHPDPVLSRLRLNDPFGKPIENPKLFFRDCKVVGFLFANNWKYDPDSLQNRVIDLCRRNPHRFKCIFVSIDSNRQNFDSATKEKPWVNMIWEDGSNVEEGEEKGDLNNEFLSPEDDLNLLKGILTGKINDQKDPRPISRVGLCSGLNIMFSPTLAIYHLESKTWLNLNVRNDLLKSKERREVALESWERGESLVMGWSDILWGLRWSLLLIVAALIYRTLLSYDDSYNIVHLVEKIMDPSARNPVQPTTPPLMTSSSQKPKIADYIEF
ncbi:hypothetical protein O181_033785 [Austropuccinia psidii MF-1]|uniref:Thioredoxin-like fold domain-containing protein n=1 Tax=Austropuccinia psidii MF-1 TaxID=1389203 RepID=A0A9Q3D1V5_9BASI|nr:hypothetical protein [Austropuccinia psidii MF-1]